MKSFAIVVGLLISNLAHADTIRTFTGVTTVDQTPCIVEEIKSGDSIAYKVTANVRNASVVYGEHHVELSQEELVLKTDTIYETWAAGVAKDQKSKVTAHGNGFSYESKGKFVGYEGDSEIAIIAELDITKRDFVFEAQEVHYFNHMGDMYTLILNTISPPVKHNSKVSCVSVVVVK